MHRLQKINQERSEAGKNLHFSYLKTFFQFKLKHCFVIFELVHVAVDQCFVKVEYQRRLI